MDGRGRLAEPLIRAVLPGENVGSAAAAPRRKRAARRTRARTLKSYLAAHSPGRLERWVYRRLSRYAGSLGKLRFKRGGGIAASAIIILAAIAYGTVRGDHVATVIGYVKDVRDMAGNAAGFRITGIALSGHKHLSREQILARAGVTGISSLLFLDVTGMRARLMADPWIADATIQKLYPDGLQIAVTEREPFALWQKDGRVNVIAADGTVMEPYVSKPFAHLPMVVGRGAEVRAREFLRLLDRHPDLRDNVRASILVADRRWNLRLKSGIDVRLPEADVTRALDQLRMLERDKKILSRDVTVIDLRLPDRASVRLSESAAQARDLALKEKAKQKKGGSA